MDTISDEIRNGYLVPASMKKIWAIQLELAKKVLDVCGRHHLNIWVDSGSLLGAVRHHGYIPWDDDFDFIMFRDDYDKLVKIADSEFRAPIFFQSAYSEEAPFVRGHAQVRMDGTTAIREEDLFKDFHQGIFIDIFVVDTVPDIGALLEKKIARIEMYFSLMSNYDLPFIPSKRFKTSVHRLLRRLYCATHSFKSIYRKMERSCRGRVKSDKYAKLSFYRSFEKTKRRIIDRKWFAETVYLDFEGILMPAPVEYDKVLEVYYGPDYMIPRQAPTCHGGFLALDSERSYLYYIPELRNYSMSVSCKK